MRNSRTIRVFITYSHKDTKHRDELREYLAVIERQNKLVVWDDDQLTPGDKTLQEVVLEKVADSDLLLYLVSAASLASKSYNKELAEALKQEVRVIPIILEHCDWLYHQLGDFEALPSGGKPINEWIPSGAGWQDVVEGIQKVIHRIHTPPTTELQAKEALQAGHIQLLRGQLDMAIAGYSDAIRLNPRFADAYNNRGIAYEKKGEIDRALKDYNEAIEIDPNLAVAYSNRGNARSQLGRYEEALADFDEAIRLNPDYPEDYNNRGNARSQLGRYEEALADFDEAIRLNPDYAIAYSNRGNARSQLGRYEEALTDYNEEVHPALPNAIVNQLAEGEGTINHRITYPDNTDETLEIDVVKGAEVFLNLEHPQLWDYADDGRLEIQFNVFALSDYRQFLYCKVFEFRRESGEIRDYTGHPSSEFKWLF